MQLNQILAFTVHVKIKKIYTETITLKCQLCEVINLNQ